MTLDDKSTGRNPGEPAKNSLPPNLAESVSKKIDELLIENNKRLRAESPAKRLEASIRASNREARSSVWALPDADQPRTKRCPACNSEFPSSKVVCRNCGILLIPIAPPTIWTSDDFEVLNFIGEGTLTTVYAAMSRFTSEEVVIKVLKPSLLHDRKTAKRFVTGAKQSLKLIHPNIARTFAVSSLKAEAEPYVIPCLVTEKVNGPNLSQLLIERKTLEPYVVASIVIDVCSALQYATTEGVEHHDLKPSNMYVSLDQKGMVPKVVDFGLAERLFRNLEWSAPPLPDGRTASIYGDPSCTSPESAFQGILSIESEIYSLGCIMYAAVNGDNPFTGNNHFDTLMQHRGKMPPPLDKLTIPAIMKKIIFKCLEKDPQDRYHSFDELKEALQQFVREPAEKS